MFCTFSRLKALQTDGEQSLFAPVSKNYENAKVVYTIGGYRWPISYIINYYQLHHQHLYLISLYLAKYCKDIVNNSTSYRQTTLVRYRVTDVLGCE